MNDDPELLRRYSGEGSEAAFTEFVGRHINLVYFTALRRTGDAATAQDITQSVFSTAAKKSGVLSRHPSLTGWLYTTTRHLADKAVRKAQTRRLREQDAAMHELTTAEPSLEWDKLRPIIDEVLDGLKERDRDAILIRFFADRPFAEIGASLRISEDAARMRVERALDKLRKQLNRRGIQSASAALAVALSTPAGIAVPAGIVTAVSGAAMATTAATGATAVLLGFMSTTKTTVLVASVATVLATGFGLVERDRAHTAEAELNTSHEAQLALHSQLAVAQNQLSEAETRAAEADKDSGRLLSAVAAARERQESLARVAAAASASRTPSVEDPVSSRLRAMFPTGIIATVGDRTITVDHVSRELAPLVGKLQQEVRDPKELTQRLNKLQNEVVATLVERNLLIKEFGTPDQNEAPRRIAAEYIEQAYAETLRENFSNDPAKFAAHLKERGMTQDEYRKTIEEDIAYGYMRQQQLKLEKTDQAKPE